MEQFRRTGEALGSLRALMVFQDDIQINKKQCCLLFDIFNLAFERIAEEMRQNLKFEEKSTKWKVLEHPLRSLYRIFKEGELYVKECLENKDWWSKVITFSKSTDCVEFHIHNLLCCIPVVMEAIEAASEISGCDQDEIQKKRFIFSKKYENEWKDPKLFQWLFGKQYLASQDICSRLETVWKEDRWILLDTIRKKRSESSLALTKQEQRLMELLVKNLDGSEPSNGKLFPSSILVSWKDYQVRRRLGNGSQYKEIQWVGESFVLRHFFGNIELLIPEISRLSAMSHPNILNFLCSFCDEEKKECFLVTELMTKDLSNYMKEITQPRKRVVPFSLPVAVDLMLQIARGMEYLHSQNIYHGDLNPSNILVRARNVYPEGHLHAKVSGFGLSSIKDNPRNPCQQNGNGALPVIWYGPEVLAEQEQTGNNCNCKYTEKADVYSFGMICFELLTGKVPFEDSHLQGDKMSRNVRAGERPLFPFTAPKYLTNLTKRCWHSDPSQRPSFSSICRILRYIKRFLLMNPDNNQPDPPLPVIDYCEVEAGLLKKFPSWGNPDTAAPVSQIPFQMFAYRVIEKEKTSLSLKDRSSESGSDGTSVCGDENASIVDDPFPTLTEKKPSVCSETNKKTLLKKIITTAMTDGKNTKQPVTPKGRQRPPQLSPCGLNMRMKSESQLSMVMIPSMRKRSGHVSD